MSNLEQLRNTAKEVLAAAVLELFPAAKLIEGGVDEISFRYDFYFPPAQISLFSKKELENIEDHIRLIIHRKPPIKKLEMMKENAALFLEYLGQPLRADFASLEKKNIVTLIQIETFKNFCSGAFHTQINDLKFFQLLDFEILSDEVVRISGTVFFDSKELKDFLKRYKQAKKIDYHLLGPQLGYLQFLDKILILLPKGEALFQEWLSFWRKAHIDDHFSLISFAGEEAEKVHLEIAKRKKLKRIASFQNMGPDLATIFYENEEELQDALISSLHFMRKAFKIFGFETRAVCLQAKPSPLSLALEKEAFEYEVVKHKGAPIVEFRARDYLGREKQLSFLRIEEEKRMVHRSLFWSLENWIALYIEKGVDRV